MMRRIFCFVVLAFLGLSFVVDSAEAGCRRGGCGGRERRVSRERHVCRERGRRHGRRENRNNCYVESCCAGCGNGGVIVVEPPTKPVEPPKKLPMPEPKPEPIKEPNKDKFPVPPTPPVIKPEKP